MRNLAVAGAVLFAALLAAEFLLRASVVDTKYIRALREPHPEWGWSLVRDVSFLHQMPDGGIPVRYNADGWRDVEHSRVKQAGVFRIAVLGDSFMEAYSVALENAFHRQLQEKLRGRDTRVEVLNFGVSGFATLQQYLIYEDAVRSYSPDLVLIGFFVANDINGNSVELERSVHTGVQKLLSRPFLEPQRPWRTMQVDPELATRLYASVVQRSPVHHSALARHSLLTRELLRRFSRIRGRLSGTPGPALSVPPEFEPKGDMSLHVVHACREQAAVTRAWLATARILERLRDAVRADGSELVVFSVPAWEEVEEERLRHVTERDAELNRLCLERPPGHERLTALLEELDIAGVDLLPLFRRKARADGETLFMDDEHWNGRAHGLAARSVADRLTDLELLPD